MGRSLLSTLIVVSLGLCTSGVQNRLPLADEVPTVVQQSCPQISVSCPVDFNYSEPIVFTAHVEGGDPAVKPTYNWEVSTGRIIDGQGTPSIKLDMSTFGGQTPTASVTVRGFDSACSSTASCTLPIIDSPPASTKIDAFDSLPTKEQRARLNAFATQLQNQPGAEGYLLVYGGRRGYADEAQNAGTRAREYLVNRHHIDATRLIMIDGGYKEKFTVELWLVPTGARPPAAEPTLYPGDVTIIKPETTKPTKH